MSQDLGPLWRLATLVHRFSDMKADHTVAAFATEDGGTERVTYGDLTTLIQELGERGQRLDRIIGWHTRETGPHGMVGDYCTECGEVWPCDTRRMAEGSYVDPDDEPANQAERTDQ